MSRSRRQMLGPIYELVCEASEHLRGALVLVPANFAATGHPPYVGQLVTELSAAHAQSLGSRFTRTYRDNQIVSMADLLDWLNQALHPIDLLLYGDVESGAEAAVPQAFKAETPQWVVETSNAFEAAREAYYSAQRLAVIIAARQLDVLPAPESSGLPGGGGP